MASMMTPTTRPSVEARRNNYHTVHTRLTSLEGRRVRARSSRRSIRAVSSGRRQEFFGMRSSGFGVVEACQHTSEFDDTFR